MAGLNMSLSQNNASFNIYLRLHQINSLGQVIRSCMLPAAIYWTSYINKIKE